MTYNGSDKHKIALFEGKQDKLVAGSNITLTPQLDGTVEISAGGGSGTVTDVEVNGTSVVDEYGVAQITMPSVPSDIDDLSDVDVSSPSNGDVLKYNSTTNKWENGEAGGGNVDDVVMNGQSIVQNKVASFKNYVEITQSQYDALPASKLTDGILYCIKDTGIVEGDKYAPVVYSLAEREIGVWTDGKPLYQKNITIPISSQTGDIVYTVDGGLSVVNAFGIIKTTGGFEMVLPASYSNIFYCGLQHDSNNIILSIYSSSSWQQYNTLTEATVTYQYTKTTDVPGSGTWGTDGVPMVHYDGTERIIGTWFGETLYTKTYHYTGTLNSNAWVTLDSSRLPSNTTYFSVTNVCFISTELSSSAKMSAYMTRMPFDIAISNGEQLYFENISNYKIYEFVVTIQYTKSS